MKKIILLLIVINSMNRVDAQVPKKVIVEHFTNTRCGICAIRNPGFYSNYASQSGVIHLAVHPSSPYSNCALSMHNPSQNDARTNYYGIFGGTPRLVIQGQVISSGADYSAASLFAPYLNQISVLSVKIRQTKFGTDSIRSTIVIKAVATHTYTNLQLFVALTEDTVFYTGSNGEPKHYDVFRKSLSGTSGNSIFVPTTVGDSAVFVYSSVANSAWVFSRITTLAILQDASTKAVIQSENIPSTSSTLVTGLANSSLNNVNVTAYFFENKLILDQKNLEQENTLSIYDVTGKLRLYKQLSDTNETISLEQLNAGIYIYTIKSNTGLFKTGKLIVQ